MNWTIRKQPQLTALLVENLDPNICMLDLTTGSTIGYFYTSLPDNTNFIVYLRLCHKEIPLKDKRLRGSVIRFSDKMVNKGKISTD